MNTMAMTNDEDYLVSVARSTLEKNPFESKAWMLTAKTLFQNKFGVQFEAYEIEKSANNCKEATKCFSDLFRQFPNDHRLWKEISLIMSALRSDTSEDGFNFLREMFLNLPSEIQHELLLVTADRSEDTMDHCRLMLLLLSKFPSTVSQHGARLVDTLMTAEKHSHDQNAVNCYRKLLVCDLLPLLGKCSVDLPVKQLFKLLHKSVEFYLCYVMDRNRVIQDLPVTESVIEDPWKNLFLIYELTGHKLGWELSEAFTLPLNKYLLWQKIVQFSHIYGDQPKHCHQLLYCTILLFLHCLHDYMTSVESAGGSEANSNCSMVLVESISQDKEAVRTVEPPFKQAKLDSDDNVFITVGDTQRSSVIANFIMAYQCWQLFHSSEVLEREFMKLSQQLRLETWLYGFLLDVDLYKGDYDSYLMKLSTDEPGIKQSLRKASTNFCLRRYQSMLDEILVTITYVNANSSTGNLSAPVTPQDSKKRHLLYLPLKKLPVLQYCSKLLISALKVSLNRVGIECDLAMGHILVLIQLDWPQEEALLNEIIERIKQRGSWTYHLFTKYIVTIDLLEEFMYLSTEQGGALPLDILIPSSSQLLHQRRISTRGVDKGAKEDFKTALRRQTARSHEAMDTLITRFLTTERDLISESLNIKDFYRS